MKILLLFCLTGCASIERVSVGGGYGKASADVTVYLRDTRGLAK